MPGTDDYGQEVPYPKLSDQPNIESSMSALANGVVALSNLVFANANERAASIPSPVVGMETYLIAEKRKEYYTGASWVALTPGPWTPLSFTTGWGANGGSPGYRLVSGNIQLRGSLARNSGLALPEASETDFAFLPVGARPVGEFRYLPAAGEFHTVGSVSYFVARLSVRTDGGMSFAIPKGSNMTWLSLDGIQFNIT